MDVQDAARSPDAEEGGGGDGEHQAVGQGERLAHAEPLEGVLVRALYAVELLVVRVALLRVHLGVLDVVLLRVGCGNDRDEESGVTLAK